MLCIALFKTNHIGDVILAAPIAEQIKQAFPDCRLLFVAASPAVQLAKTIAAVDHVIDWSHLTTCVDSQRRSHLQAQAIDVAIQLNPDASIARDLKQAGIPQRISSGWRLYNWRYCNRLVNIPRNRHLHKSVCDYHHLKALGLSPKRNKTQLIALQRLTPLSAKAVTTLRPLLSDQQFNLIIHPKSVTAQRFEWPIAHYITLIQTLLPTHRFRVLLGGTQADGDAIRTRIHEACPEVIDLTGKLSLTDYFTLIRLSDGLIAGSTGPLHLAAIAGIHCLGIYRAEPRTIARWHPLGPRAEWISDPTPCSHHGTVTPCHCVQRITPTQVLNIVHRWKKQSE